MRKDSHPARPNPRDATLERSVGDAIERGGVLPVRNPLLVAVSGGPDSVALLHVLVSHRARFGRPSELVVGHVHHGLRGAEADADAAFVRDLADRWSLRFAEATLPVTPRRSEEDSRIARYNALRALAENAGARRVATAHTADDQAETVLLRLFRGAGLRGLSGMPRRGRVCGIRVVRPLLAVTREQVLDYLRRNGIAYRVDSSNLGTDPARNFIRHEIVPRLQGRLNPSVREAILRGASAIRDADAYFASEARRLLPDVIRPDGPGKMTLDAVRMLAYPNLLRAYLFRYAVQELHGDSRDLASAHIEALLSLLRISGRRSTDLPGNIRATRIGGFVMLERKLAEPRQRKESSKT